MLSSILLSDVTPDSLLTYVISYLIRRDVKRITTCFKLDYSAARDECHGARLGGDSRKHKQGCEEGETWKEKKSVKAEFSVRFILTCIFSRNSNITTCLWCISRVIYLLAQR